MAEQVQFKSRCDRQGHCKHLCSLTDDYFHVYHPEEYRDLVKDGEFKCQFCGRTAKRQENVCYPAEL